MTLVRLTTTPGAYKELAKHLVCWARTATRIGIETGGPTLTFVVDQDQCAASKRGALEIGTLDVCTATGTVTIAAADIPTITDPGIGYAGCAAAIPTATIAEDTADVTRMTTKVTVTLNGPATVTFGEVGHVGDDGVVAQGANKSHQYTTPGTYSVTVKSTTDPTRQAVHNVTVPYTG